MKYDIEARNRLHRVYGEILVQHSGNKTKMLELFKEHQLMIPKDQLTLSDKRILAQTCANIFNKLFWAETLAIGDGDDEKVDRLNQLGNNIDPMGNYWWGLYDDTYKDFIPALVYTYIHNELIGMYDSLFGGY